MTEIDIKSIAHWERIGNIRGPAGESIAGPVGLIGPKGEKGDQGEQGIEGKAIVGPPGPQGEKGDRGDQGEPGKDGIGKDGKDGIAGAAGARGEQGPPGRIATARDWSADLISYEGVVVTHAGSTYQARSDTTKEPPHSDWIPIAVAGRDGRDGLAPIVRGTYQSSVAYRALDIVAKDGGCFIAKSDEPGPCPGPDWQIVSIRGQRGEKGERGISGPPGPAGQPAPRIESWRIDRVAYTATPILSDGTEGAPIDLRPLFEQFQIETGDA